MLFTSWLFDKSNICVGNRCCGVSGHLAILSVLSDKVLLWETQGLTYHTLTPWICQNSWSWSPCFWGNVVNLGIYGAVWKRNKKDWPRRSVETLGLSSHRDWAKNTAFVTLGQCLLTNWCIMGECKWRTLGEYLWCTPGKDWHKRQALERVQRNKHKNKVGRWFWRLPCSLATLSPTSSHGMWHLNPLRW